MNKGLDMLKTCLRNKWFDLFPLLLFCCFFNHVFPETLLVSNYGSSSITAYDTTTGLQLGSPYPITTDINGPLGIVLSPDRTILYVANNNVSMITAYAIATGMEIGTPFPIMTDINGPYGLAISPDGSTLYVANNGSSFVTAYNTTTGMQIISFPFPISSSAPSGLALSPDGTTLYVPSSSNSTITAYNTSTGSQPFTPISQQSPGGITVSPDGSVVYATSSSNNTITAYNTTTGMPIGAPFPISVASEPIGICLSTDGSIIYVGIAGTNPQQIAAYDTANGMEIIVNFPITDSINDPTRLISFIASSPSSLEPPTNLSGKQKTNDFGLEYELFNRLTWTASTSSGVTGYFVYRNGIKIATLNASTLSYEDHKRQKGVTTSYSVTAFNGTGAESSPINTTIY
jgi:sugar lactone lactonase YvrE